VAHNEISRDFVVLGASPANVRVLGFKFFDIRSPFDTV